MFEESDQSVRIFSYQEDQPTEVIGSLIPRSVQRKQKQQTRTTYVIVRKVFVGVVLPATSIALLALITFSGYGVMSQSNLASAPTVTIFDATSSSYVPFPYGPQLALSKASFFEETRDAFIDESLTFVEVDISEATVRFFEDGVLLETAPILATGELGSWWDAPSGLYKVEKKDEKKFSTYAQVYFPWSITFEGNYVIHGIPEYPNGDTVEESYVGGGVRIDNDEAERLFGLVDEDMPVLVHKKPPSPDVFIYEPAVPTVQAEHYFVADLGNGSVLAASDLHDQVPIASITKLMTAVVAAEKMSLDRRVRATSPTFVESLIPRLSERSTVSMYSLLQLLLVESSNEAAEIISGEYGRDLFIEEMNAKARLIGMNETKFTDPSGLDAGNVSTLGDLYQLTRHIYEQRNFIFEITATGEAAGVVGGGDFGELVNFNEIEGVSSFVGGKVGETNAAGQTSISIHTLEIKDQTRVVAIILLGSPARTEDIKELLMYVEKQFNR